MPASTLMIVRRPRSQISRSAAEGCHPVPASDHPADAADVLDDVLSEFPPDIVDEYVDGIALDLVSPVVEPVLELAPREDRAGSFGESPDQRKLLRRQHRGLALIGHLVTREIEGHRTSRQG